MRYRLLQAYVGLWNKFVQIANMLGIELENLVVPSVKMSPTHHYFVGLLPIC